MTATHTVHLPDIGEGVVEGEVIEWLKKPGDRVEQDEPIVVVMTDKVTVELPAPYPGILAKQYYKPGQMAYLDKPIYDIELEDGQKVIATPSSTSSIATAPEPLLEAPKPISKPSKKSPKEAKPNSQLKKGAAAQVLATPGTRKLARDMGVDIESVIGTGKEGRVTDEDLRIHVQQQVQGPALTPQTAAGRAAPLLSQSTPIPDLEGDERQPILGIRKMIAEKMVEAKYIAPHFSFFDQLDATRLVQMRKRISKEAQQNGVKLTFMPFFIRALSLTLDAFPQVNASVDWQNSELVVHKRQNMGIAMNLKDGLLVPVLKDMQGKPLGDVILAYEDLKQRAVGGSLTSQDMKESTITISNFGALGGQWATPVINYPEIAILGLARIQPQVIAKQGQIVIQERLNLSWTFDHRVIDGSLAASFSRHFVGILENPSKLL